MDILIGCEYTAIGRDEFRALGYNAWSCDIDPTEGDPRWHYRCDIFEAIRARAWRLIILHPECTRMALCGNRWWAKTQERIDAVEWTCELWEAATDACEFVVMENPASVLFPELRKRYGADVQYIQPHQFGHTEQKKTGLALHNVPHLVPTHDVYDEMMLLPKRERERVFYASPSNTRGKDRSRSYPGIMQAMAQQWPKAIELAACA